MQTATSTTDSSGTTQTTMPSPLIRLPGELRNHIYREYFQLDQHMGQREDQGPHPRPATLPQYPARKLRSEAASIFYEEHVGDPGGNSKPPSVPDEILHQWEITGNSKKAQPRRLTDFCQSLVEHKTTDVNIAIKFDVSNPAEEEVISPGFVETLTNFMVFVIGDNTEEGRGVRVHSSWQRARAEVLGTDHGELSLLLTRTFQGGGLRVGLLLQPLDGPGAPHSRQAAGEDRLARDGRFRLPSADECA